uniref:hypothetical protein n=1 Tax=Clostridium sp. NkU-1 TaxID=1095009 RepID=UPI000B0EF852
MCRRGSLKKDENIQHLASLHKELERLKESYTLALDSANDALWEWNLLTDEIITSDKWIDITGNASKGHGSGASCRKRPFIRRIIRQCWLPLTPA